MMTARHPAGVLCVCALRYSRKALRVKDRYEESVLVHTGVPALLDVPDMLALTRPDKRSVVLYVALLWHAMKANQCVPHTAARTLRRA